MKKDHSAEKSNRLMELSGNWKDRFPDWHNIKPGEWSEYGEIIDLGDIKLEIGLYHEPEDDEYAGTYTLQIFVNDDVIYLKQIEM